MNRSKSYGRRCLSATEQNHYKAEASNFIASYFIREKLKIMELFKKNTNFRLKLHFTNSSLYKWNYTVPYCASMFIEARIQQEKKTYDNTSFWERKGYSSCSCRGTANGPGGVLSGSVCFRWLYIPPSCNSILLSI